MTLFLRKRAVTVSFQRHFVSSISQRTILRRVVKVDFEVLHTSSRDSTVSSSNNHRQACTDFTSAIFVRTANFVKHVLCTFIFISDICPLELRLFIGWVLSLLPWTIRSRHLNLGYSLNESWFLSIIVLFKHRKSYKAFLVYVNHLYEITT